MSDEHDRLVEFALQPHGFGLQLGAHNGIDGAKGFIHEEDVRVGRQATRNTNALLLATRQLTRVSICKRTIEPDRIEKGQGALVGLGLRHLREQQHGRDVVDDLSVRQ